MFGWFKRLFGKKPATGGVIKQPTPRLFGEGNSPPFVLPPSKAYSPPDKPEGYIELNRVTINVTSRGDAIRQAAQARSHHSRFNSPGRPVDSSDDLLRMVIMTNLASDHSAHRGCDEHVKPEPVVINGEDRSAAFWLSSTPDCSNAPSIDTSSSDSSCSSSSD